MSEEEQRPEIGEGSEGQDDPSPRALLEAPAQKVSPWIQLGEQLAEMVTEFAWFVALLGAHVGMEWFVKIGHLEKTWVAIFPSVILWTALIKFSAELLPKVSRSVVSGLSLTLSHLVTGWRHCVGLVRSDDDRSNPSSNQRP